MREYGQIQSAFWQAPDIVGGEDAAALSDSAKLLACFLLTGPTTNGVGCFPCGDGVLADLLKWSPEFASERFAELEGNGFAYRSFGVVFLPNFLRWNRIANGNVAKARFQEWEQVPKGRLKSFAARAMLEFSDHWSDEHRTVLVTVGQTVSDTPITVLKNQNPTQPNPTLTNPTQSILPKSRKSTRAKATDLPEGFLDFWSAYPRKEAKGAAVKAYAKTSEAERRVIATVLPLFAGSWKWTNEPQYIPHPTTWLNQRRWEDDPPPKEPLRQQRTDPPKQSRQAAIFETLANDHRHASTAARLAGTGHPRGIPQLGPPVPGLRTRGRPDPDHADCLDADFSEQGSGRSDE